MSKLIPFSSRKSDLANAGFGGFYSMLDDFFTDDFPFKRSLANDSFKLDIQEKEDAYIIEAELPGVKKEELKVTMDANRLKISVEHEEKVDEEKKNYIHKERRYCSMERNILLADADAAGIKAKLNDGVLEITVPKKQKQTTSTNIEVE